VTGPLGPNAFYGPSRDEVDTYRRILGYTPSFTAHPGLTSALAKARPSHEDLVNVAGFVDALELAKRVRLARSSGAVLDLTDQDRAYLSAIGEQHDDVDLTVAMRRQQQVTQSGPTQEVRHGGFAGFLTAAGQFGPIAVIDALTGAHGASVIVNNPVTRGALKIMDRAADIAGAPYRLGVLGVAPNVADIAETVGGMQAKGYNPSNPVDVFAYYFRGEQVYHDLNDLRREYGAGMVTQVQRYLDDPAAYLNVEAEPDTVATRIQAVNDPRFKQLIDLVQSRHISPGRDFANALHIRPGTKGFTAVSGGTDALVSWFLDPTLVAGKAGQAVKISRRGLNGMTDGDGIRRVMATNGAVRRGFTDFLENARAVREGTDPEKAAGWAKARAETPDLMPLMDEINGRRYSHTGEDGTAVFEKSDPITGLDELTEYLVHKNALTRLSNGLAAWQTPLMPGAVSRYGYRRLKGYAAAWSTGRAVAKTERGLIDFDAEAAKLLPTPGDAEGALNAAAQRGAYVRDQASRVSARWERTGRRLSMLLPTKTTIGFYDEGAAEQVRRFAGLFMPRSEANLLAAKFAAGDLADRRAVYKAMSMQVSHAAGLTGSASGQGLYDRMLKGLENLDHQAYSVTDEADTVATDAGLRRMALNQGQLSPQMWLPPFAELRKVAAKLSVYDHLGRKWLESDKLDRVLPTLRLGWMTSPSGGLRNALDEQAGVFSRGMAGDVAKMRVTLSQQRALALARRELPEGSTQVDSPRKWWTHRALGHLRLARHGLLAHLTDDELSEYAAKMGEETAQDYVGALDGLSQAAIGSVVVPRGADEVGEITAAGFRAGQVTFRQNGWGLVSADGLSGARAWATNLDQWMEDPVHAKYLLTLARGNTLESEWDHAVQSLLTGDSTKLFREQAEIARPLKTAADDAERRVIAEDIVHRQVTALRALVMGRDTKGALYPGQPIHELVDYLERYNRAPSVDWLTRKIPTKLRPEHAIGRKWVAMPVSANPGLARQAAEALGRGYSGFLAKSYELAVSKPAAWLSRHPIYGVNYAYSRRNLKGYQETLEREGLTPETAEAAVHRIALQHAYDRTVQMVDNPEVASQFSVISRNFYNFERATEDWLRRWGRTFKEDPARVRRLQLAYEGAEHSGIIDRDPASGDAIFVYPGSGHAINAALRAMHVLSLGKLGGVQLPMMPDLTSKVLFLNASLDNPVQLTASPVIAMPWKIVGSFFPQSGLLFEDIDRRFISGDRGAGQPWWNGLLPTVARRFLSAMSDDDRNGQLASSVKNGMLHLEAAGLAPPNDADPSEVQQYIDRVKTQARNQLFVRALFAFFLPAAPSAPENTVKSEPKVDTAFLGQGVRTLRAEYKELINRTKDPLKASAIWAKLHPDLEIYTVATTESTSPDAYPPVTRNALKWMEANFGLFRKYRDVAPYFVPPEHGEFSLDAWNAMLESGLRQHKTLSTYYRDLKVVNAEREYYDAKTRKDQAIAQAQAAGDDDLVRSVRNKWSRDSQIFMGLNPLFSEKLNSYGARTIWRQRVIGELEKFTADPDAGDIPDLDKVRQMIQAYRSHDQFTTDMRFRRDAVGQAQKNGEQAAYDQYQLGLVGDDLRLTALYNGVFRGLD
jgi:hypothetical protein